MSKAKDCRPKHSAAPKVRRTHAERIALSDQLMADAAIDLLIEGGTHATTLQEVGQRAGYSRGLAHARFGSKEALLGHIVELCNQAWLTELARQLGDQQKNGLEAFLAATEAVEAVFSGRSKLTRAMYIIWFESVVSHGEVRARQESLHEIIRDDVKRWIRQGKEDGSISVKVNEDVFSIQYCAFVFGLIYQSVVSPSLIDFKILFDDYRKVSQFVLLGKAL